MDKQTLLYGNLKNIKDYWVKTSVEGLVPDANLFWSDCTEQYKLLQDTIKTEGEISAYKAVINEVIKDVLHSILVMIDGGDDLADNFLIDLVDETTKESLKKGIELHDEFFGYLLDVEE